LSDGVAEQQADRIIHGTKCIHSDGRASPTDIAAPPEQLSVCCVQGLKENHDAGGIKAQGFACLAIANSHFDPTNVAVLRETSDEIRALGLPVAFPDFTRRALAQTLTEEFMSGACHAGQFETSLVMADRPDLVNDAARSALEANPASLTSAFARGAKTFAEAGGPDAYFGAPGRATAAEGAQTFQIMAAALVSAICEVIEM